MAPFSITRRIQFSETDLAGIVHFAHFFRMLEEVEHAYFRSVGLRVSMQHDGLQVGWPRGRGPCATEFSGLSAKRRYPAGPVLAAQLASRRWALRARAGPVTGMDVGTEPRLPVVIGAGENG